MRRAFFIVLAAASWTWLLVWAAAIDWRSPWLPTSTRLLPGSQFSAVFGTATPGDDRLHVEKPAADFSALQSSALYQVDAADFKTLRYRFADFPRTLELSLVFRSADRPGDVQSISLPWPGCGTATFDLSREPAWHGAITEIGFAEYATPQLVPPKFGFAPFELVGAELWSPSWRGAFGTLATDWFGVWPWSQRSLHVLGRDSGAPRAHSLVVTAALAVVIAIGWAIALLRWRAALAWRGLAIGAALAWLVLDAGWFYGLWARLLATRAVYAEVSEESSRQRIVGDSDIRDAADKLKSMLAGVPSPARILVYAESKYSVLRFIWHMLPLNVSDFGTALAEHASWPDKMLIVFYASDAWRTDAIFRRLLLGSERVPMRPSGSMHANGFETEPLTVFRYHHAR